MSDNYISALAFKTAIDKITDAQVGKTYIIIQARAYGYTPSLVSGAIVINSKTYQGHPTTACAGVFIVRATDTTITMDTGGNPVIYAEI